MAKKLYFLFGLLLWIFIPSITDAGCPKVCTCALKLSKKIIHCSSGNLLFIPISEMDVKTHELVITAPPDKPNNLTIGRMFNEFNNLETVRITHSNIPAVGEGTFWPGRRMRLLDLSHNKIRFLRENDFYNIKNLQELYLNDNEIFVSPSAPFRYLINLRKLSLARNKLQTLVPRFFYLLSHLEELDLSGNALGKIEPEDLLDVRNLKILNIANCQISHLHHTIYQKLPLLEELNIRENLIASLAPAEFRHLTRLSVLYLDGNLLKSITEGTFSGQNLRILGLSRNNLSTLSDNAFTNSSVKSLDMSHNKLDYVLKDTFEPFSQSLEVLNISFNDLGNQAFSSVVYPLKSLKVLQACNLMVNSLFPTVFMQTSNLKFLNLSRNNIADPSPSSLTPLRNLEELDLSFNAMPIAHYSFLQALSNLTTLRAVHLVGNPFDCTNCAIDSLIEWLNESQLVEQNCSTNDCLQCQFPQDLNGVYLYSVSPDELWCRGGVYERQLLAYTSQIGMIVAIAIIVIIVCIILAIIVIYRRHIAHYYTHEEERRWKGMYENPALAPSGGVHFGDDKPTFIATPDKVDENIDDFRPSSIMR